MQKVSKIVCLISKFESTKFCASDYGVIGSKTCHRTFMLVCQVGLGKFFSVTCPWTIVHYSKIRAIQEFLNSVKNKSYGWLKHRISPFHRPLTHLPNQKRFKVKFRFFCSILGWPVISEISCTVRWLSSVSIAGRIAGSESNNWGALDLLDSCHFFRQRGFSSFRGPK